MHIISDDPMDSLSNKQMDKAPKTRKNPLAHQTDSRMFELKNKTGDITFNVGTKQIKAHKCVLAALSPKYMAQFYGEFGDAKKDVIDIPNISTAAFEEYLQFFYLDQINLTHEHIRDVLTLTEMAAVDEFTNECFKLLTDELSVETVCQSYQLAIIYNRADLISLCEHKISTHSSEIFTSEGFLNCTPGDLYNILQSDSLDCKETDVFQACILWAKNACTINGLDPEKMENLRKTLIDSNVLYQIRFGTMVFEDFMQYCYMNYKNLFTEEERDEIFFTISKVKDAKPNKFNDELRLMPAIWSPYPEWNENQAIVCDRTIGEKLLKKLHFGINRTAFITDRSVILGGFCCGRLFRSDDTTETVKCVPINLTIVRKNKHESGEKILLDTTDYVEFQIFSTGVQAKFRHPILVQANYVYEIQLEIKEMLCVKDYDFKTDVIVSKKKVINNWNPRLQRYIGKIVEGTQTIVRFLNTQGLVTGLILNIYDK